MYIRKRRGPNNEPWETLLVTSFQDNLEPLSVFEMSKNFAGPTVTNSKFHPSEV